MPSILTAARGDMWAIDQAFLLRAVALAERSEAGAARQFRMPKVSGSVAILPLHGVISQRASLWQEIFGGTSTEGFGAAYTRAVNDPKISGIVLDVDSPGGTTAGVQELGDIIDKGAALKPTVAVANSQAASAAYWLASQVGPRRFAAAPGAEVGSIGVFRMHEDISGMLAEDGVKVTFLAVPQFKTEGNPFEPLTEAAVTHHMSQVEQTYQSFVEAVARGRNVSPAKVRSGFGEGRSFHSQQAVDMGLVDRVATLSQVLNEMGANAVIGPARMALDAEAQELLCDAWQHGFPVDMRRGSSLEVLSKRLKLLT